MSMSENVDIHKGRVSSDLEKASAGASACEESQTCHFQDQLVRNERIQSMRKAKSRNAARTRRGKENYEFYELAKLLPISVETSSQLDKASIIRLTMSYLRVREFALNGHPPWNTAIEGPPPNRTVKDMPSRHNKHSSLVQSCSDHFEQYLGSYILQSLDGFVFALNCRGKFIYVSENISIYLGLSQVEMIGSSIFDYVYPMDQDEMAVQLGLVLSSNAKAETTCFCSRLGSSCSECSSIRSFYIRMKSTLTRRGVTLKSSCYKVVHLCTRSRRPHVRHAKTRKYLGNSDVKCEKKDGSGLGLSTNGPLGIFGMGTALPAHPRNDLCLERPAFVTRLNPALKFTYCETVIESLLGYDVREVIGRSFYQTVHVQDIEKLKNCHSQLLHKGQMKTPYYRWLHKSGGYVWIHSSIMVLSNHRLYPEESFIWINYIISEHIDEGEILGLSQSTNYIAEEFSSTSSKGEPGSLPCKVASTNICSGSELDEEVFTKTLDVSNVEELAQSDAEKYEVSAHLRTHSPELDSEHTTMQRNTDEAMLPVTERECSERKQSCSTEDSEPVHTRVRDDTEQKGGALKTLSIEGTCRSSKRAVAGDMERNRYRTLKEESPRRKKKRVDIAHSADVSFDGAEAITHGKCVNHGGHGDANAAERENDMPMDIARTSNKSVTNAEPRAVVTQSISEYLDADSLVWENPPNKEISNHNDLPPGIKQMHGMCGVRHTPSAVHHHYPFGIDPNLLRSNPILAKIMMAGWGRCRQHFQSTGACIVAKPVPLLSSTHVPLLGSPKNFHMVQTPASVAAVLEELKKDPLHKVNPPNKVVNQRGPCEISRKDCRISSPKPPSDQTPCVTVYSSMVGKKFYPEIPHPASLAAESAALFAENLVNQHIKEQTLLQMPNALLVPPSTVLVHSSGSPFVAIGPDSVVKLPISSASFQKQLNPCVLQSLAFPPVAEIPSVPL